MPGDSLRLRQIIEDLLNVLEDSRSSTRITTLLYVANAIHINIQTNDIPEDTSAECALIVYGDRGVDHSVVIHDPCHSQTCAHRRQNEIDVIVRNKLDL